MRRFIFKLIGVFAVVGLFVAGGLIVWAATLPLPTLDNFNERVVTQTTKIYDQSGEHLLYDVYKNVRRTVVPLSDISPHMRNATIAIEDENFYNHYGIEPTAILRASWKNLVALEFTQGGSTLTQQVVKNSLLTQEKTITRKIKEWILAVTLEQRMEKDRILELYLNEVPYGGSLYGVEAAAQAYFNKPASDLTIAEAAYLAALPKAPTYYAPHGPHRDALDARKNEVLAAMRENGFITQEQHTEAQKADVTFQPRHDVGIQAPHFVMYVRDLIAERYGQEMLERGGLKVRTSLDIEMQQKAQEIVGRYAKENEEKFNAENAGMIVIDPDTGQILAMVGSRDYFDTSIDGNFNVTTAHRQPGSSFKPFAYAQAFREGYTPSTILFDLKTQFSTACTPGDLSNQSPCYAPTNYDNEFRGPMTMRDALAQSVNIPAIKTLYLAGLDDTFQLAREMGIKHLTNPDRYGLTLVLGGGEVSLLNLTSAYSVFANDGVKNPHTSILSITKQNGDTVEEFEKNSERILETQTARQVSDVLADNQARTPAFGARSPLHFPGHDVAAKTGTTNDYRDAWIIGYTPDIAVGAWAGNNDNSSMEKRVAGFVVAPMWNEFMNWTLKNREHGSFREPRSARENLDLKPILRGKWRGGISHKIDSTTGTRATENTPEEALDEILTGGVHSILHWVSKNDPRGPIPSNPAIDGQYHYWEQPVRSWVERNDIKSPTEEDVPDETSEVHDPENAPEIEIREPKDSETYNSTERITIHIEPDDDNKFDLSESRIYLNNTYIGSSTKNPTRFTFVPQETDADLRENNTLRVVALDRVLNQGETEVTLNLDL